MKQLFNSFLAWWNRPVRPHPYVVGEWELARLAGMNLPPYQEIDKRLWSEWRERYPNASEPTWAPRA